MASRQLQRLGADFHAKAGLLGFKRSRDKDGVYHAHACFMLGSGGKGEVDVTLGDYEDVGIVIAGATPIGFIGDFPDCSDIEVDENTISAALAWAAGVRTFAPILEPL